MSDPDRSPCVRFGPFELDTRSGELRRGGTKLSLAGQPVRLLEMFLRRPGQVVPIEELHRALWPSDVHVDFEHGLRAAVRRLRAALDDSAEDPAWIETLPRKGYRYVGPAPEWVGADAPPTRGRGARPRRRLLIAGLAGALVVAATALASQWASAPPRQLLAVLPTVNVTGDPAAATLCDVVTEEIVSRLAQADAGRIGVVARAESAKFTDVTALTYALRVDFVVEASLVRESRGLQLNARLIRITDRTQLWAASFDLVSPDAEAATQVARATASAVQSALGVRSTSTDP
jgi:DNA-binding winged helix-turn-helix (wHTH) protein/TolB-like protein